MLDLLYRKEKVTTDNNNQIYWIVNKKKVFIDMPQKIISVVSVFIWLKKDAIISTVMFISDRIQSVCLHVFLVSLVWFYLVRDCARGAGRSNFRESQPFEAYVCILLILRFLLLV